MTVNELIVSHIPFADRIAAAKSRTTPMTVRVEELRSAAYLGLVDAANKYDSSLCDDFRMYAGIRIAGAIRDYLRELGWGSRKNPRPHQTLAADVPAQAPGRGELFEKAARPLSGQGRRVFESYFVEGKTQQEIGDDMGVSKARICQILASSCEQVRSRWGYEELRQEVA